jgi:hypothetical protein
VGDSNERAEKIFLESQNRRGRVKRKRKKKEKKNAKFICLPIELKCETIETLKKGGVNKKDQGLNSDRSIDSGPK